MKTKLFIVALLAGTAGWFAGRSLPQKSVRHDAAQTGFQCPMHPWVKAGQAQDCTICGMDLVAAGSRAAKHDCCSEVIVMLPQGSPGVMGVETAEVRTQRLARTVRVAGMIGEDESRHATICAPVEGRIDALAMNACEGESIGQRQPMANIYSRTLLAAAGEYKTALVQGGDALNAARKKLLGYGLVQEQIDAIPTRQGDDLHFGLLAPRGGTIEKSYVSDGQSVKEGDKLFEVADLRTMWFVFSVAEQDLPFVAKDQFVNITAPSLPGQPLRARINFVSPLLDEATRSARVRVVIENRDRLVRNNTYAEGLIETDAPEVLTVPRSAVLWSGTSPRVYVEQESGTYQQRVVQLGRVGDAAWELLDGVKAGERVVVSGNMLIDSQAQLERGMSGP
jgi:membrane fusion protein, copper/silver efflux system